jgi:NTP pyrophosphatase (non-canonical NTP hydrolase)
MKSWRDFIDSFMEMQDSAADINRQSGFTAEDALHDEFENYMRTRVPMEDYQQFQSLFPAFRSARVGLKLMLSVGELSETLEAVRKNIGPDKHIPEFTAEEAEVADCVIRLMNYATDRKLRLADAIVAKNEYNRTRHDHSAAEFGAHQSSISSICANRTRKKEILCSASI